MLRYYNIWNLWTTSLLCIEPPETLYLLLTFYWVNLRDKLLYLCMSFCVCVYHKISNSFKTTKHFPCLIRVLRNLDIISISVLLYLVYMDNFKSINKNMHWPCFLLNYIWNFAIVSIKTQPTNLTKKCWNDEMQILYLLMNSFLSQPMGGNSYTAEHVDACCSL